METFKKTTLVLLSLSVFITACETTKVKTELVMNQRGYRDMRQHTNNENADVFIHSIAISPDGGTLAYSSNVNKNWDIFVKSVNSKATAQKTDNPAYDIDPAISPDGTKMAFASSRNGNYDIYVMNMAGGKATRQITFGQENEIAPSWSHDGKKIVYSKLSKVSHDWEIWTYNFETGAVSSVTNGKLAVYSPINDSLVFQRGSNKGWYSLWVADDEGKEETNIITSDDEGYANPSWSADGSKIAFISGGKLIEVGKVKVTTERKRNSLFGEGVKDKEGDKGVEEIKIEERRGSNIWVINSDGSNLTRMTDSDKAKYYEPKFSSDGRLYFISADNKVTNIFSVIPEFVESGIINKPLTEVKPLTDVQSKTGQKN